MQSRSTRLVKKYGNRRLYDTTDSRYITMEELAERIRAGADVRVVDAQTNEDLTQATLTQIIIEGRGAARFFSVQLLSQLIRMGDDALADFLGRYLTAALELYLQARQSAQAIAPYNPLASMPFAAANALGRLFQYVPGWGPSNAGPMQMPVAQPAQPTAPAFVPEPIAATPVPAAPAASDAVIESLRRDLEALKAQMQAAPAKKPAGTRKGKRK